MPAPAIAEDFKSDDEFAFELNEVWSTQTWGNPQEGGEGERTKLVGASFIIGVAWPSLAREWDVKVWRS